jgi:hypothetical protein
VDERPRDRILKRTTPGPNECLLWTGAKDLLGYGKISAPGQRGRVLYVHRAMKELSEGPIPAGYLLANTCGHRQCVEPEHWQVVPTSRRPGAVPSRTGSRTHCRRGHELTPENVVLRRDGRGRLGHRCRMCDWINLLRK